MAMSVNPLERRQLIQLKKINYAKKMEGLRQTNEGGTNILGKSNNYINMPKVIQKHEIIHKSYI